MEMHEHSAWGPMPKRGGGQETFALKKHYVPKVWESRGEVTEGKKVRGVVCFEK